MTARRTAATPGDAQHGAESPVATNPRKVKIEELVGPSGVLLIEHGGEFYRLRITSNGKLLLTK